jgi:hypothetical protein
MPKTVDQFANERKEIVNKIFNILEITPTNKMISLKQLDEDINKQNKLIELESDIQKYFICSKWNYFNNKKRGFKRKYISLLRSIMKNMDINFYSSIISKKGNDNKFKHETLYIFEF